LSISKQLLPVYDKAMIYYPLDIDLSDIWDILTISTPRDLPQFQALLGNGAEFSIRFSNWRKSQSAVMDRLL
jgi:glucose-1-phosphate thymidylyltransferase